MDDDALRYSRHIALAEIGAEGQARLKRAQVLIVGLGGLGSPAALYLAAAGVGTLALNDFDTVDATNLQRQILFGDADVGVRKTAAAARSIARLNAGTRVVLIEQRLQSAGLESAVRECDVVLDGSDNFGTRFAVNAACVATGTPLVSGAAIRFEGQLAVFRADLKRGPCYRCLYHEASDNDGSCSGNGVVAPLVGVIGSMMAVEAVKVIAGLADDSAGRVLHYDALGMRWREIRLRSDPACPVCAPVSE